ncbi:MAG TPA: hypothetical protein VGQ03_04445, partial [Nitrososphaera sp.]|nr:hypothetical protein [Nitrososphaera sp.]
NATAQFMGDWVGGSGWEVTLPDGSVEKYYVNLPSRIVTSRVTFVDQPKTHLGKDVSRNSIEEQSTLYINYLTSMVNDAKKQFKK